ncbi:SH3 domain-containing protein [Arcicella sp. LKC2W]|uniref:SH3 domain-containing protein n=1 Tax=Arcicella sp. LKC2W TaxID=2984198 RepID=UPI002B21EF28|nr:SH3 domain-containing protein [Arcicella sp. LKC2W]MEA5458574.1 SH3 domain-containing protein [Arcicella sp. LKC2W]
MQANYLKKIIFFLTFFLTSLQLAKSQSDATTLRDADSLYKSANFFEAEPIFEQNQKKLKNPSSHFFLKLASIKEKKGDFLKTLYYLNKAYEQQPSQKVLLKLNEIGSSHELQGYELNDFNFLILFYKQYSGFLVALLMVLGIYIFIILFIKKYKRQFIPMNQKIFLLIYLLGIGLLLNLPDKYHQGIINHDGVYLRAEPSGGAAIAESIDKGHRLNVIGGNDIWKRVIWNDKFLYIKESDIWLVE